MSANHQPLVIAHRGDSSRGLENSLDAFRLALEVPVDLIELDLRMSRDGRFYVMHDRQTGRTANRDIDLEQASAGEIDAVRLVNGEQIPRLHDVFRLAGTRAGVNIEIKSDGAGTLLAQRLQAERPEAALVVTSFQEAEVAAVHKVLSGIAAGVIYDAFSLRHVHEYADKGYSLISLRKNTVTEHLVQAFHSKGIRVFVWTVDDADVMKRLMAWEVDGIYTNRPVMMKEMLGNLKSKK